RLRRRRPSVLSPYTTLFRSEFFGIGGGIPVTPFGAWSYDFTEEQAQELLQNCPARCVLVSHSPPKGAVDRAGGQSLGSVAVRDADRKSTRLNSSHEWISYAV